MEDCLSKITRAAYTSALSLGGVADENIAHVIDLGVARERHHRNRQVALERAEQHGAEIKVVLEVIVVIRLVVGVRFQAEPVSRFGRRRWRRGDAIGVASYTGRLAVLESVNMKSFQGHDNGGRLSPESLKFGN